MCNRSYISQEAMKRLQRSGEDHKPPGLVSYDGCATGRSGGGMRVTE